MIRFQTASTKKKTKYRINLRLKPFMNEFAVCKKIGLKFEIKYKNRQLTVKMRPSVSNLNGVVYKEEIF